MVCGAAQHQRCQRIFLSRLASLIDQAAVSQRHIAYMQQIRSSRLGLKLLSSVRRPNLRRFQGVAVPPWLCVDQ